jgi:hypothetical protein
MSATVQFTKQLAFNLILHKLPQRQPRKWEAGFPMLFSMEDDMPLFHMNIRKGDELFEDWEGQDFPSLSEARTEAVQSARELMAARMATGKMPDGITSFEIADVSGKTILIMPFEEAIIPN